MMKIERFAFSAATLIFLLIFCSCSKKSDEINSAIDAIPDNVRFAAVLDATTPDFDLSEFLPTDLAEPFSVVAKAGKEAVDLSVMALFTLPKGYTLGVVKVEDAGKLLETLGRECDSEEGFDDFEVFECGKRKIAVGRSVCYIAPDLKSIKDILKEKPTGTSQIEGIRKFLATPDEAVKTASIASDIYGKKLQGLWLCRSMRPGRSTVSLQLSLLKPDGESGKLGELLADEINPAVAGFIPTGCTMVAATGKQREGAKLFGIESILRSYIPVELNLSASGTTAWYARPAGALDPDDLLNPADWNFASLSQSSQAEADEMIASLLDQTGHRARMNPDTGCYTLAVGGMQAVFGYLNGFSVIGLNGDITYGHSNSYLHDFNGERMVILIEIPKGSRLQQAAQLPCGASFDIKVSDDYLNAKIHFYGNTSPALETIDAISPLHNLLPFIMGLR